MVLLLQVAGLDAYEAMPVEAFGEAMMRGMGWQEGKSVGKNAKAVGIACAACLPCASPSMCINMCCRFATPVV